MGGRNFSLVAGDDGRHIVAHRPDCVEVQRHREQGKPIMNLFDCRKPIEAASNLVKHSCLKEDA